MFVIYIVLCVWMVGRFGGSPAKLILRLRVIKLTGSSPTYIQVLLRQAPYLLFWLINLAGLYVTLSVLGWSAVPSDYHVYMLQIRQHQSMWSHNAALLCGAFLIADFIVLSTNAKHRALHDLMAGTAVTVNEPPLLNCTVVLVALVGAPLVQLPAVVHNPSPALPVQAVVCCE